MSMMMKDLEEKIKNLPPEYRSIMNNGIIIELSNVKNRISEQIYDSKKQELIEKLDTQINFILPESLKNEKYDSIKKDLTFYKKAYESEAANVNKIIEVTNKLNHELYEPLKNIKNELNKHCTDLKNNVNNIVIPHDGMNKGIDSIKNNDIVEKNKKEFENDKVDLNKSMNSYRDKAIEFFKDYNIMNDDLTSSIKDFLNSFNQLRNNVNELKHEINEGFKIFENISPELEDLEDKEKIRELTESLLFPLDKITKLNINLRLFT